MVGPGVGIIATLPERFGLKTPLGSMDGTSMASPAACAALAVVLSQDETYRALPLDLVRATRARALLGQSARDIGLAARFQGQGVPCAESSGCADEPRSMRQRYVIAVRREMRGSVRSDRVEWLGAVQGATVTGATDGDERP